MSTRDSLSIVVRLSFKNSIETLIKDRVTGLEYKFALTRKFSRGRLSVVVPTLPPAGARTTHSVVFFPRGCLSARR